MHNFSAPMPYSIQDTDKLLDLNNLGKSSAITSLYACVPHVQKRHISAQNPKFKFYHALPAA